MMGLRIAALRKAAGWSQAELARRLKISASAVGMYEQGRREPSVQILAALSELFDVSIDYLVTGKPDKAGDRQGFRSALHFAVAAAEKRLENRQDKPFSRQELAVLLAAMLTEP